MLVGIDIGGTSVKCGLVTLEGKLIERSQKIIEANSPDDVADLCEKLAKEVVEKAEMDWSYVAGVGLGCPGQIDKGNIFAAANFPHWKNVPLEQMIHERVQKPVILVNDADAAIAAEHWVGTASGLQHFLMLSKLIFYAISCNIIV